MARRKRAEFDERLTLVEHLDELRTRIIICVVAVVVTCGVCFWQNHALLDIVNNPLPNDTTPITLSPAEPFLTTFKLSMYAGLILALPILLYQAYAFVLPALSPAEKRTIVPFLLMIPVLFIMGVVFGYYVVLPAALKFLLNFNDTIFNTQIRAADYYSFVTITLLAMGLVFQVPMAILAVVRLGIVSIEQLRKNRRYAYLILAVIAMLLPGTDPVTMLVELVPLLVLYEISIVLARFFGEPVAIVDDVDDEDEDES
jgi:sec-independent protein translocase protein TatC